MNFKTQDSSWQVHIIHKWLSMEHNLIIILLKDIFVTRLERTRSRACLPRVFMMSDILQSFADRRSFSQKGEAFLS